MHKTITIPHATVIKRGQAPRLPKMQTRAMTAPKPILRPVENTSRFASLDVARGIAIFLMILSHGVVGLVPFDTLSGVGLIPVHLVTKFSSTLFILVFGISLALFYGPAVGRPDWTRKRFKLVMRGIEILVWYKVLTFIQMFQTYDRSMILEALLFIRFPDFVEVLGFYGLFLLWFPFAMRAWTRAPLYIQAGLVVGLFASGHVLNLVWPAGFWIPIKAIFVEEQGYFTFGQFQRGALALMGMMMGTLFVKRSSLRDQACLAAIGALCLAAFYWIAGSDLTAALTRVASNVGKHPPSLEFMLFSFGGALILLAGSLMVKSRVPLLLESFASLGRNSLQAFVFHIFVIFVFYRYLLDLRHQITYPGAIGFTLLLVLMTVMWVSALEVKHKFIGNKFK